MNISVVIPTYNRAASLQEAIRSVLAQTCPVNEIIVVDDGSTDNTGELVRSMNGIVRYAYQENQGPSAARNRGIREAQGDWVAFLDSDDLWLPAKIERQVEEVRRNPDAALVYTSVYWRNPDGTDRLEVARPPSALWPMIRYRNPVCGSCSAVLARRDVLIEENGFNQSLHIGEDWDLWVRIASKHPLARVEEPVVILRTSAGSQSSNPRLLLDNTERMIGPTLLRGLPIWKQVPWRRRIRSAAYYRAASLVSAGSAQHRQYLLRSVAAWPFPDFMPERGLALAKSLLGEKIYEATKSLLQFRWIRRRH
jgi:glycosyltransferase involved in cell wall biosynthesis